VDYSVWRALQQMVYRHKLSDSDCLKRVLIDCWTQLSHDTLNRVINQLPKKLMMVIKAKCVHVEFRVDKVGVQMIVAVAFTVPKINKNRVKSMHFVNFSITSRVVKVYPN